MEFKQCEFLKASHIKLFSLFFLTWFIFQSLLNLLQYCFCFMFWFFGHEARGIMAPRPRTEPTAPALEGEVLTNGQPGKSLALIY